MFSKKVLTILSLSFLISFSVFAQNNKSKQIQAISKIGKMLDQNPNWIKFYPQKNINAQNIFQEHPQAFALGENDQLILKRTETDDLGFTHYRFQQVYKNIPIEGGEYLLHEKNGVLKSGNGKIVSNLNLDVNPILTPEEALKKALDFINAKIYIWENPGAEDQLKHAKNDPNASFRPIPELIISQKNLNEIPEDYRLLYRMEIYAQEPHSQQDVYVDAKTGEIYDVLNLLHTTDVPARADTKYSGDQQMTTDSVGPNMYRLRESSRGGGIETFDMNESRDYAQAVDFIDTDNYWKNFNAQQDEVATDCHWGSEMTYDYFFKKHGRNSFDNQGAKMISYVHFDQNYVNAFWNGRWMTYGDGNGSSNLPLTSLDVVGHEITHGVDQYSASLRYRNESGALDESFADIFGNSVEYFAHPANFSWNIGEAFSSSGGFRSMSNPKSKGDPDTYFGQNWFTGTADNGGVHTNSGVQNFWYYLMVEGGTGTNDNGHFYNIQAFGFDTASKIAYRNTTTYLSRNSTYADARLGAILSAEDLYGECSFIAQEVSEAWQAVGVGQRISDFDLWLFDVNLPNFSCGFSNAEVIRFQIRYEGCDAGLTAGDTILAAYKIGDTAPVLENIILTNPVSRGDTIHYTFSETANLLAIGTYEFDFWINYPKDTLPDNDSILNYEVRTFTNRDVGVVEVIEPFGGCDLTNNEVLSINWQFFGCDDLPAGTQINFLRQVDGGTIASETFTLGQRVNPFENQNYTFSSKADLSGFGNHKISVWANLALDSLNFNDSSFYEVAKPYKTQDDNMSFESQNAVDSFYRFNRENASSILDAMAGKNNSNGILMTGGDAYEIGFVEPVDSINVWDVNENYISRTCFCVDARNWNKANVQFDLKQNFSLLHRIEGTRDLPKASNLRLLINGNQVGQDYYAKAFVNTNFETKIINLDAFAGSQFEACFESRNIVGLEFDKTKTGDLTQLDNIWFREMPFVGLEEVPVSTVNFMLYPNPSKGLINVVFQSPSYQNVELEIYDFLGKKIHSENFKAEKYGNLKSISLQDAAKGWYLLKLSSNSETWTKSFVIE